MPSRNECQRQWTRLRHFLGQTKISTKITCLYAAILFVILIFTSIIMGIGVYASFYHQSETEIHISMEHIRNRLSDGDHLGDILNSENFVLPGVILSVTDITGQGIYKNDMHYPSLATIEAHRVKNPPFWANRSMEVSKLDKFSLYHATMNVMDEGQIYQLHFFRTITAEQGFLAHLQRVLFLITIIGFLIALLAGYFLSSRILKPIRDLTQTARKIEVERMDRRIEVPPVHDELAELAITFNHMLDRLEAGFRQQQRFVSDASHELRTPVTVILGYSDLLSRWGSSDKEVLEEGISSIRTEAEDMQQLIEKLLFLARADQKRQVIHKEYLELSELVDAVVRKMKFAVGKHSLTLGENDEGRIFADPVSMRQMLRIFLENAVKYTPDGGHIQVSSKCMPGEQIMQVEIADDGIGISSEDQGKIFDRFYRADPSRTKAVGSVGGTGLGLSIARWIADQHGIQIDLVSELGKGSTFLLKIPLVEEAEACGELEHE